MEEVKLPTKSVSPRYHLAEKLRDIEYFLFRVSKSVSYSKTSTDMRLAHGVYGARIEIIKTILMNYSS